MNYSNLQNLLNEYEEKRNKAISLSNLKKENLYNYMIEKYIKKGGRLFTLGSDAHNIKDYTYKFDEATKFLLSKNIKEIILFKDKIIMQKLLI